MIYSNNLQSISIPNGVNSISIYCFCICDNLKSISIQNGVTSFFISSSNPNFGSSCFIMQN